MGQGYRRHHFKFWGRVAYLYFFAADKTGELVERSYDNISTGYDEAWTSHMRQETQNLIDNLELRRGENAIDLTCGTGYASNLITQKTRARVTGVDKSAGMLDLARKNYGGSCGFVQADILEYLKSCESDSIDVVTCCWGLGYSRPLAVLRQIKRVLRRDGKIGIIDNSIFSLREVMRCSMLTFMEQPAKLQNVMKFRFLTGKRQLAIWMRLAGLKPTALWDGEKSYFVSSGAEAIQRLQATGAAAGFEFAASREDGNVIFERFGRIIEMEYLKQDRIRIAHRYLAGVGVK